MTTTNPVPSNDPTDLLFNAQKLDQVVNGSDQYYTDRLGVNRRTMVGISAAADVVLGGLGYAPPVLYAAGISMTLTTQTVEYSGEIYAPKVASLPFTTSTWATDSAKFRLIQGVAATDLAASGGAGMIGYTPSGTGAVATNVQSKLRESVSPEDFGALGNGTGNDATALTNAIAHCSATGLTLRGDGSYRIEFTVNFRFIAVDFKNASINVAHAGIGILIGGNANSGNNPEQKFGAVTRSVGSDSQTTPTIRAIGVKGQHIHVDRTTYFQVYADTHSVGQDALRDLDYSSAYSSFWLKYVDTIELTNNPANAGGPNNSAPGGLIQWINENQFYLNRTTNILINGTYTHNHNKFYNGTLENTASINIDKGLDNCFYGMRFEGGPTTITFGANSARNVIEKTWSSSENVGSIWEQVVSGTVTDNGVQNTVFDSRTLGYSEETVAAAYVSDVVLNTTTGVVVRQPNLNRISAATTQILCASDLIPCVAGDEYTFLTANADPADVVRYRPRILFYSPSLVFVNASASYIESAVMTTVSGPTISTGTGVSSARLRITAAGEAAAGYIRVEWNGSNGQNANALARTLTIRRASKSVNRSRGTRGPAVVLSTVTAIPTQGFAPLGWYCSDTDGLSFYICTFSLDTSLSAAASSGATAITVTSGTGTVNGDIIGINLNNRDTHWTTIASGGGTTSLTLTVGLPADAASGSRVVFNRWATK